MIAQEPPPGCVITWYTQYDPRGPQYQYIALHVAGRGWYTSDTRRPSPWTWNQLRARIGRSPTWVVTGWAPVAHVIDGETISYALPAGPR